MPPSISVIVTHHNRPDLVRKALESVWAQTVKPTEVILIDDSSTPENRENLNSLSAFATILDTPADVGPGAARNYGARAAKGEWLCFLDDDDLYLPDKLERQIRYLKSNPTVDALGGGLIMVRSDGRQAIWGGTYTGRLALSDALYYTASMAQALMIKRDVFLELCGFSSVRTCMDDREFGIRLVASGREVHFLGEPLFVYHVGGWKQHSYWRRMFTAELTTLRMHKHLLRREFGRFGHIRMRARCFRRYGLQRGRLSGRALWAFGRALETIFGRQIGKFDTP